MPQAQQQVKSPSNVIFTLRETGDTAAEAETNLANRAAVTVGTNPTGFATASVSGEATYKTLATGASEEAVVKARSTLGGRIKTLRLTNLPLTYSAPDGSVTNVTGSALETYLAGKDLVFVSGKFAK